MYNAVRRLFKASEERPRRIADGEEWRSNIHVNSAIKLIRTMLQKRLTVDAQKRSAIEQAIDDASKVERDNVAPQIFYAVQELMKKLGNPVAEIAKKLPQIPQQSPQPPETL